MRKWETIEVKFDDGHHVRIARYEIKKLIEIHETLRELEHAKQLSSDIMAMAK